MNRHETNARPRISTKTAAIPRRTWWPEIAGAVLLIVAALETAKVLA